MALSQPNVPCTDGLLNYCPPVPALPASAACTAGTVPKAAKSECVAGNLTPYELSPGASAPSGLILSRIRSYISAGGIAGTAGTYRQEEI
jgi:hypothetical protein